ncbi:MAG TPA: hypothetical protein DCY57_12630 [Bacteroidetes bacterium]|nr:hypothetical protein [Bacteroidota bacterium]
MSIAQKTRSFGSIMLILISNADVYAPHHLGMMHVLVAGGHIAYIGQEKPQLDPLLNVDHVDAAGARLIPGFIDAHAHVTGGGGVQNISRSTYLLVFTAF